MLTDPAAAEFLNNLLTSGPHMVVKIFFVLGVVMYGFFAIAVVKQVSIMTDSIDENINGTVRLLSWVHLLLTILVGVVAAMWL